MRQTPNEIERIFISELMASEDAYYRITPYIGQHGAEVFDDLGCRTIYTAVANVSASGLHIDPTTVMSEIMRMGLYDSVGGYAGLSEYMKHAISPVYIEDHAAILLSNYQMRKLGLVPRAISSAISDGRRAADVIDLAINEMQRIKDFAVASNIKHVSSVMDGVGANYAERMKSGSAPTIRTGFQALDDHLGGFERGDFIVLAGRSGSGKSTFALSFILNAATSGAPTLYFSAEMSELQSGQRLIGNWARINYANIRKARLIPDHERKMMAAMDDIRRLPIYVDETGRKTISDIESDTRKMVREKGVRFIVIDYLQKIKTTASRAKHEEVGDVSERLKNLAKEQNVAVLALVQLSRKATDGNRIPRMEDIGEADQIQRDADVGLIIHSFEKMREPLIPAGFGPYSGMRSDGVRLVSIGKSRHDREGDVFCRFEGDTGRILPLECMNDHMTPSTGAQSNIDNTQAPF